MSITKEGKLFLRVIKKLRKWHTWSLKNIYKDKMKEEFPFEREKPEIVEKQKAKTNSKYGCYPEKRHIKDVLDYGIVNINKQQGPTSHQITDYVKKILGIKKAGHSGTLEL